MSSLDVHVKLGCREIGCLLGFRHLFYSDNGLGSHQTAIGPRRLACHFTQMYEAFDGEPQLPVSSVARSTCRVANW